MVLSSGLFLPWPLHMAWASSEPGGLSDSVLQGHVSRLIGRSCITFYDLAFSHVLLITRELQVCLDSRGGELDFTSWWGWEVGEVLEELVGHEILLWGMGQYLLFYM